MKPLLAGVVLFVVAGCGRDQPTAKPAAAVNAVQNEMRLLTEAMRDTVTAIGTGQLAAIPEGLHEVHRARELTEQAIESGSYKLPRNAENLAAFKALDESFHAELEKLVAGASANDAAATSAAFGAVMSRCDGCHAQFRPAK